jgi:Uma2 family endonuclease
MEPARKVANRDVDWKRYVALPEDDRRELVDGVLLEVEVPTHWHEWIVAQLVFHLMLWARRRNLVVLGSGYKVRISNRRGAMPDVQVLTAEAFRDADPQGMSRGRPEIVVEVISPSSRGHDRVRKLGWHASIGVPEYWIVDPEARTLERCVLDARVYDVRETAEGNVTFKPKGLRGLSIPMGEIWSKLPARRRR